MLEAAIPGLCDHHVAVVAFSIAGRRIGQITPGPGCDDVGGVLGVSTPAQHVVGVDEEIGLLGWRAAEKICAALSMETLVGGRVQDQQCPPQETTCSSRFALGDVVEEVAADAEHPTAQADLALTVRPDGVDRVGEEVVTWPGSAGAPMVTTAVASGIRDAAASTAAPPRLCPISNAGSLLGGPQVVSGGDQVVDVGGKVGVGEVALAGAQAGEVEPQHGYPKRPVPRRYPAPRGCPCCR